MTYVQTASGLSVLQIVKWLQNKKVVHNFVKHKRNRFAGCLHILFSLAQLEVYFGTLIEKSFTYSELRLACCKSKLETNIHIL